MNIQDLLNSPSSSSRQNRSAGFPYPPPAQHYPVHDTIQRRQKLAKDAPVFSKGTKTVGYINYPPHEAGNDHDLHARHHEYRVFPVDEIRHRGVRRIPYASDKKDFLNKTGRDAFEGVLLAVAACTDVELTVPQSSSIRIRDLARTKSMSWYGTTTLVSSE